mmetsp:Transcript_50059/g.144170  ORF Transcript_50059/g.144170 Transcript_50059/m.144170 type:complete len:217 (+) Transcript_50059:70-720(+)
MPMSPRLTARRKGASRVRSAVPLAIDIRVLVDLKQAAASCGRTARHGQCPPAAARLCAWLGTTARRRTSGGRGLRRPTAGQLPAERARTAATPAGAVRRTRCRSLAERRSARTAPPRRSAVASAPRPRPPTRLGPTSTEPGPRGPSRGLGLRRTTASAAPPAATRRSGTRPRATAARQAIVRAPLRTAAASPRVAYIVAAMSTRRGGSRAPPGTCG